MDGVIGNVISLFAVMKVTTQNVQLYFINYSVYGKANIKFINIDKRSSETLKTLNILRAEMIQVLI